MHFSVPDYEQVSDGDSSYTSYRICINGVYHCSSRYSQLHGLYESLVDEFGAGRVPAFPPKRLFALTPKQLDERRCQLETFVQLLSQDPVLGGSDRFNTFLLNAQRASHGLREETVSLDVRLMNGKKRALRVSSTDRTDAVLEAFAQSIELPERLVHYFGLFVMSTDSGGRAVVRRRLQEFELPYVALADEQERLVVRKSYWDASAFEDDLLDDAAAVGLLYTQACSDLDNGWYSPRPEEAERLAELRRRKAMRDFLLAARACEFYGCVPFYDCHADYPEPDTPVQLCVGKEQLYLRPAGGQAKAFRIVQIRRWRLSTSAEAGAAYTAANGESVACNELSFEYLLRRDSLKWFRVNSPDAVLISLCLQSIVDEVLLKKSGRGVRTPAERRGQPEVSVLRQGRLFLPRGGQQQQQQQQQQGLAHWSATKPELAMLSDNDSFVHAIGDDDL